MLLCARSSWDRLKHIEESDGSTIERALPSPRAGNRWRERIDQRLARHRSLACRWPIVITAGVVAGALVPQAPLRDATTLDPASDVTLAVSAAFLAFSPVFRLLDALMLLGTHQHYAVVSTLVIGAVAWRATRGSWWKPPRPWRQITIRWALVSTATLGVYALSLSPVVPPLSLRVADPDVVVVDFHSHTNFSWDGRPWFTVERNRAWHRAAGWNVAYITDHTTLLGAAQGIAANPRRAGADTTLLPGVETRRTHLVVLGLTPDDWTVLLHGDAKTRPQHDPRHVVIQVIPSPLMGIAHFEKGGWGPRLGLELSDADPRGLAQEQLERAALLEVADARNLAVVAGSNNHGWTSTPVAWSLLRIPGWRGLTPEALDVEIQNRLRDEGRRAVRIVERYGADVRRGIGGLAVTVPAALWHVLATLTFGERLSWLAWAWGGWLAGVLRSRPLVASR